MARFLTFPQRRFHPRRYWTAKLGTWSGHLPFANDLIWAWRPKVLVELGTHYGESYFGFCQAVQESGARTRCFAVDTWRGDQHSGFYGDEVYQDVSEYNKANYQDFSTLIRETFNAASEQFEPESIDLLHIDGLHTYSAVKHDFDTWFAKVRPGGVVLLHDTDVRRATFGVWQLWGELTSQYPHFRFRHSWGLGVMMKPGGLSGCDLLDLLFDADDSLAERIREGYSDAAELMDWRERGLERTQGTAAPDLPYLQIFPGMRETGFQERDSVLSYIDENVWKRHVLNLPQGIQNGFVRIDVVNRPALVDIGEIAVRLPTGELVKQIEMPRDLARVSCGGHLMPVVLDNITRFFSWGHDPQLIMDVPCASAETPLQFEITMRVSFSLEPLRELLGEKPSFTNSATK